MIIQSIDNIFQRLVQRVEKTAGSWIQERCNFTFETPLNRLLIVQSELLVLRFRLIQLHKDKKYRGKSIVSG